MLPFTQEQFFEVFAAYNMEIWPAAIAAYPIALLALALAWRGTSLANRWVPAILALMWGWVGFVYHGIFFSRINPIADVFAAAFIVQALLFALHAVSGRGLEFNATPRLRLMAAAALAFYAMVAYPLIGALAGERYPAMPLFGVAPCPLLIFTFALLLAASRARWWLWVVPLAWALVGGSASLLLGVRQDWALPLAAIIALLFVFFDESEPVASASSRAPARARRA
jgi:Family of unknown function (DUF6064)